jgi:protein-S-isoprenylcysteine O-methyltransferase
LVFIFQLPSFRNFIRYSQSHPLFADPTIKIVGAVLCAAGIFFAIWARRHLGKNWSGYPSEKQEHQLITSGPYAKVRHPIYTGMLAALFGSALTLGFPWLVALIIVFVIFLYRIKVEERLMLKLFPSQYPEYIKRTKMLIPFVI